MLQINLDKLRLYSYTWFDLYKKNYKDKAIKLRQEGYSYRYISNNLGMVKSTLSEWFKGICFVPNDSTKASILRGQKKSIAAKRVDKLFSLREAERYAEKITRNLRDESLFFLGIGIYIGEGNKVGSVRIVNSDPRIVRFSVMWLKKFFEISDDNLRVRIHTYPDNDLKSTLYYWTKELNLSKNHFQPFSIDRRLNKKLNRAGVLPYGTAHLGVKSNGNKNFGVLLHRKILATIDRVLDKRD